MEFEKFCGARKVYFFVQLVLIIWYAYLYNAYNKYFTVSYKVSTIACTTEKSSYYHSVRSVY